MKALVSFFLAVAVAHVGADLRVLHSTPLLDPGLGCRLKIITGGDDTSGAPEKKAMANQRAYASRHGYQHKVHVGNYAHPWTAYWHKIHALLRELMAPPSGKCTPDVVVWMDLDVVVTNPPQKMLEQILSANSRAAIILTEDPVLGEVLPAVGRAKRLVNTGIIIVRRGPDAISILKRLFDYGKQHFTAAYQSQDKGTLHEQDAFNWLMGGPLGQLLGGLVSIIPQRLGEINLNTFARNLYDDNKYKDPENAEWVNGDFTAHCSGLQPQLREWCIDDSYAAAEAMVAAYASDESARHQMNETATSGDGSLDFKGGPNVTLLSI